MKYDGKKLGIDRLVAIQGGITWVEELQYILDDGGHGEPMFEVPTPAI